MFYNFLKCINPWNKFGWENWLPASEAALHVGDAPSLLSQVQSSKSSKFLWSMEKPKKFYNQCIEEMEVDSTPSPTSFSTEFSEIQTISQSIMSSSEHCKFKIFYNTFWTLYILETTDKECGENLLT